MSKKKKNMITPAAYVVITFYLLMASKAANGAIGMNWGRQSAQRLVPSMVVDLLLQNGVEQARIYTSQGDILQAFSGSGINLTISVLNISAVSEIEQAKAWVQKNVPYFGPANIRQVFLGNYMYNKYEWDDKLLVACTNATKHMQDALNVAGYGDHTKANLPHPYNILKDGAARPSDAEFCDNLKPQMNKTLRHLIDNGVPFVVQIFPNVFIAENKLDPEFAFVGGDGGSVRDVGGAVYTNAFEFMYDSVVWALEKAGAPGLDVVVGQVGWPTDGYPGANVSTAERFFKGLLPFVASDKGTPKRPGKPIETYLHSLTDENRNPSDEPFTRHWGIYRSNGMPKYKIDLSGRGRNTYPARARGIQRMPKRWCTFNNDMSDLKKVWLQHKSACDLSDCTSVAPGGSCSHLNFTQNISYAFNMFFQSKFQDEDACKFGGLGRVVLEDPSAGGCVFPVEVVRGQQVNILLAGDGQRLHEMPAGLCGRFFLLLITILWVL